MSYLEKVEAQERVVAMHQEYLTRLRQEAVDALSPVKVGQVVDTVYFGGTQGIVESITYMAGWRNSHLARCQVRLLNKDGSPGERVTSKMYALTDQCIRSS